MQLNFLYFIIHKKYIAIVSLNNLLTTKVFIQLNFLYFIIHEKFIAIVLSFLHDCISGFRVRVSLDCKYIKLDLSVP